MKQPPSALWWHEHLRRPGVRQAHGVTDLRWFSLRDANAGSGQLENGYGLLGDDYSPKPAFAAYQRIIASEGA